MISLFLLAFSLNVQLNAQPSARFVSQFQSCRSELSRTGIPIQKQSEFCQSIKQPQWNCSAVILKKYRSLELAKEICLSATNSESACYTEVMDRNFDPYVAKRVCRITGS